MIRRPPSSPRPSPLFRDTTLFRSGVPAPPLGRRGGRCWYRLGAVVAGEDALLPKSGNGERGMAAVSGVRFLADPDVRARTPGVPGGAGRQGPTIPCSLFPVPCSPFPPSMPRAQAAPLRNISADPGVDALDAGAMQGIYRRVEGCAGGHDVIDQGNVHRHRDVVRGEGAAPVALEFGGVQLPRLGGGVAGGAGGTSGVWGPRGV